MQKLKKLFTHPLFILIIFAFLITSWPFANYPFTDADIGNWVDSAKIIRENHNFTTAPSDQSHGPLLIWTAAILTKLAPNSFYFYNLFNLLCGLVGLAYMYYFSLRFWKNKNISILSTFLFCTSIVFVYLSRTPMYDWPATIAYFGFTGFYILYIRDQKPKYLIFALLNVGIGSLSRFSICFGLAIIVMLLINLIYKKSYLNVIKDGFFISLACVIFNFPWLYGQTKQFGADFLRYFIRDNVGRYIKSTRPDSTYHKDFYSFPLTVLLGILPHTFALFASFFQKGLIKRFRKDKVALCLAAAFLPCLLLFSFSGHTKLARYIAYVFPSLIMLLGYNMACFDLGNENYRKRCGKLTLWTAGALGLTLIGLAVQFSTETKESMIFVSSLIILLFSILLISYYTVTKRYIDLKERAHIFVWMYAILYMGFFSVLTYESLHAKFLVSVRQDIINKITIESTR